MNGFIREDARVGSQMANVGLVVGLVHVSSGVAVVMLVCGSKLWCPPL